MKRAMMIVALALALGGCWGKKASKADDQRTASGQILPGSTSDAMIAYDALTSRAPVAPRVVTLQASSAETAASQPQADEAASAEQ